MVIGYLWKVKSVNIKNENYVAFLFAAFSLKIQICCLNALLFTTGLCGVIPLFDSRKVIGRFKMSRFHRNIEPKNA